MRALLLCPLLFACTDQGEVPATVVRVQLTTACATPDCGVYSDVFYDHCGPFGTPALTPSTQDVKLVTEYKADEIDGYVQLQYTARSGESGYLDDVLRTDEVHDVYGAYDYVVLYRVTASGEVIDIDQTRLAAARDNTLQFRYVVDDVTVVEEHEIDPPVPVHMKVDSPGLAEACCSAGSADSAGLLIVGVWFAVRRRQRRRTI